MNTRRQIFPMTTPAPTSFDPFFRQATGQAVPFDYQRSLAEEDVCRSRLVDVPTGCGKTAAVVLAWLWNRVAHPDAAHRARWPRRLVYCLPMRTLVEQTQREVRKWLLRTARTYTKPREKSALRWLALHSPVILMGGEPKTAWEAHSEADTILIGTQDMLLSRALNRGYGLGRSRWPMAFGLLNNDCLWVMDETQLMGVGVETSAQLDAFRQTFGTTVPCRCWWMSATLESARLETVDHPAPPDGWPRTVLGQAERASGEVARRYGAVKYLSDVGVPMASAAKADVESYQKRLAEFVAGQHVPGTLTLVVVNRVARAQAIYQQLKKSPPGGAAVALVHSRFRPPDRRRHEEILFDRAGRFVNRIVVATQAVEAGVDVSARTLVTELAPWSSLVQRFGRCNRYAEADAHGGGRIFWADLPAGDDKAASPYRAAELDAARGFLRTLTAAGPRDLQAVVAPADAALRPVVRRKDLLDLFDTTADLCGADLDISRYVRDGEDTDVQVYWRPVAEGSEPSGNEDSDDRRAPVRDELCRVGCEAFAGFLTKEARAWRWNALAQRWERPGARPTPLPGAVYLLACAQGGYSAELGWTGNAKTAPVEPCGERGDALDGYADNRRSFVGRWVKLRDHTAHVVAETARLCEALALPADVAGTLRTAALWHDAGKAHPVFQEMLTRGVEIAAVRRGTLWAKSDCFRGPARRDGQPSGFRHELASALLWLQLHAAGREDSDLVAYLIAAHHGKVRLSLRALPGEEGPRPPRPADTLFARGVWDGDVLPAEGSGALEIDGETIPPTALDLAYMRLGEDEQRGASWLARAVGLRDAEALGPFRLAFLETVLRAADWRASAGETNEKTSVVD